MTFRDKLRQEKPHMLSDNCSGGCQGCPSDYGYEAPEGFSHCVTTNCWKCWSREVPSDAVPVDGKERV